MSTRSNGSAVRLHAPTTGAETQTLGTFFFDLSGSTNGSQVSRLKPL